MAPRKSDKHVLVMTPGPGGHFQSPAGTEVDEQLNMIVGGSLMAEMTDDDGNPPEAIEITIAATKAPRSEEEQAELTQAEKDHAAAVETSRKAEAERMKAAEKG